MQFFILQKKINPLQFLLIKTFFEDERMFTSTPENETNHGKSLKVSTNFSGGLLINIQIEGMHPHDNSLILTIAKEARQMIAMRAMNDEFLWKNNPARRDLMQEILKTVKIVPLDKNQIFLLSEDHDLLFRFFGTDDYPTNNFFHLDLHEIERLEDIAFGKSKKQVNFLECWTRKGRSGQYVTCDGGNGDVVPSKPKGVDIQKNIDEAKKHYRNLEWFRDQFKNKGPWDYKQLGSQYEDFWNFHYGFIGKIAGIPDQLLLRAAGWAQSRAGTSKEEWGEWYGLSPYGDDPKDQEQIKKGIKHYENNHGIW